MGDARPLELTPFEEEARAEEERGRAREILQAALAEAARLREAARHEGFAKGLEEGREAAAREARERAAAECRALPDVLGAAARAVAESRAGLVAAAERDLLSLAIRIAEKIVKAEVAAGRPVAAANLKRALELAVRRREVRVRIHPADLEAVETYLPELRRRMADLGEVALEGDPSVSRGGAVVVTPEGAVDADLRTQIEEIERGLLG